MDWFVIVALAYMAGLILIGISAIVPPAAAGAFHALFILCLGIMVFFTGVALFSKR